MLNHDDAVTRESIRDTIARYNDATDRADLAGVAACFTTDGSLQIGPDEPIPRDQIVEVLSQVVGPRADDRARPTHVHHHVSSTRFRPQQDGTVHTDSYFVVLTQIGTDHWGRYRDVHAIDDGEWRLRTRRILTDGFAPDSLLRPTPEADHNHRGELR